MNKFVPLNLVAEIQARYDPERDFWMEDSLFVITCNGDPIYEKELEPYSGDYYDERLMTSDAADVLRKLIKDD